MYTELPLSSETQTRLAARLFHYIENNTTDLAPSTMALDPRDYFDPELARREREEIFASVPILAAHGSELAMPNDFITARLPNNEVVVVRQPDGGVKSFVNVCRHRGAKLVLDTCGSNRVFACGYHGWTYNPDGALRSILGGKVDFGV